MMKKKQNKTSSVYTLLNFLNTKLSFKIQKVTSLKKKSQKQLDQERK